MRLLFILVFVSNICFAQSNILCNDSILQPKSIIVENEKSFDCLCEAQLNYIPIGDEDNCEYIYLIEYSLLSQYDCKLLESKITDWKDHLLTKSLMFSNEKDWNNFHKIQHILKERDYFAMMSFYKNNIEIYEIRQGEYISVRE